MAAESHRSISPDALTPRPPQTTHEWVRDRLRTEIYDGVHQPGSRLVQTDLAERYAVSVTPVREAMRDLATDGLITARAHRAATVRELDIDEAIEINDLRAMLEVHAVRLAAASLTDSEIAALEDLHQQMLERPYQAEWVTLNDRFHLIAIEATRGPVLIGVLQNLRRIARFYYEAALRADNNDFSKRNREHAELLAAFRAHDGEAAAAVMARHLTRSSELRRRLTLTSE